MAKLTSIAVLAALGLATGAYAAQNPVPPDPADTQATPPPSNPAPDAASSPHQRDVTKRPGEESLPNSRPDPEAAATPHQQGTVGETPNAKMANNTPKMVGAQVISPAGESLGSVVDVTMDRQHQPEYAVISTGNDTMTAVPYSAVAPMVKNNRIVIDRTRLQNSPQVAQSELRDKANSKWRADADKYWSAGALRTATPGAGTDNAQKQKDR